MKYLNKYKFKISRYTVGFFLNIYQTYLSSEFGGEKRSSRENVMWRESFFPVFGVILLSSCKKYVAHRGRKSSIAWHGFFFPFFRCAFFCENELHPFSFFHHHRHHHESAVFFFSSF
jgi:hypothetical protein